MKPSDFIYQYLLHAAAFPPQNEAALHYCVHAATWMWLLIPELLLAG